MIIARQKKESNIAEYILYMWQIEDVIRSHNFDIEAIERSVIDQFDLPVDVKMEMKTWYENLINDMKREGVVEKGHLAFLREHTDELNSLHNRLLTILQDKVYLEIYYQTKQNIDDLIHKSGNTISGDVEACLTGLYGLLVLKLKGTEVGEETRAAMATFSKLLAYLSHQYQLDKSGALKLSSERNN